MKVINKTLLKSFTVVGNCEVCGKWCARREGHHIFTKGAGRVDVRCNLIALGASVPFPLCQCHVTIHGSGKPTRAELLAIAGKREGKTPSEIEDMIYRIRRDTSVKVWIVDEPT